MIPIGDEQPQPARCRDLTLLLVEDSEDDAFFFERKLKRTGIPHKLKRAVNGAAAINVLQAACAGADAGFGCPDIVFLDLKMPVVSGFDVLAWLQAGQLQSPPPVIVLSGSDDDADRRRATALGASGYLVKPISEQELQKRLLRLPAKPELPERRSHAEPLE